MEAVVTRKGRRSTRVGERARKALLRLIDHEPRRLRAGISHERQRHLVNAGIAPMRLDGAPSKANIERAARAIGCRPSHLRRCALGLAVSVGAARRIMSMASVISKGREVVDGLLR